MEFPAGQVVAIHKRQFGTALLKIHERELLATSDFIRLSVQHADRALEPSPRRGACLDLLLTAAASHGVQR